ncbi:hypothetical protein [Metabacillus halosaccharovorans]|uniref:hypothetical protein n=1 Tax=Metabacillus halosaccharovorans TaxID=930124 RepID=UPI00203EE982|nr:hypothetical protein [Metabacillus halosaccharovorans]MCM3444376.1 hypothetical protein [Metabacillus halosaccharovorans]
MQKRVIKAFRDKETLKHYAKGDLYVSDDMERITFLLNEGYLEKVKIVIENTEEEVNEDAIEHVGGGYYILPNGEKVKGKKKAHQRWGEINAK